VYRKKKIKFAFLQNIPIHFKLTFKAKLITVLLYKKKKSAHINAFLLLQPILYVFPQLISCS